MHIEKASDTISITKIEEIEQRCHIYPWSRSLLEQEFSKPFGFHFVTRDKDNKIIGYLCGCLIKGELQINNLSIHPVFQNCGLGTQLLRHVLIVAQYEGAEKAFLEVRKTNTKAIHLYRKTGFKAVDIRKRYYNDNEDAIVMVKVLSDKRREDT